MDPIRLATCLDRSVAASGAIASMVSSCSPRRKLLALAERLGAGRAPAASGAPGAGRAAGAGSHHTLAALRESKRIADAPLMKLFRAAEALRQEADPIAAAMGNTLEELWRLRNKLAKLLGVTGPYLGRVLRGEKPMTEELAAKLAQTRDDTAVRTDARRIC